VSNYSVIYSIIVNVTNPYKLRFEQLSSALMPTTLKSVWDDYHRTVQIKIY